MIDTKHGRELEKAATPGRWDVYVEKTPLPSDVYRELEEQARHNVTDKSFTGELVMLTDGAHAPAITGCGPTSRANADLIVWLRNNAEALLTAAERVEALLARVEEVTGATDLLTYEQACAALDAMTEERLATKEKLATAERRVAEPPTHAVVFELEATLATLRAENERLREFARWVAEREDAEDVSKALTNWDHADVYRVLAEAIDRARAALKGGAT